MDLFDVLTMIGGLSLFLFGMNVMGNALERCAGSRLPSLLGKLTSNPLMGLLTGLAITGVVQSSSATTVMVVGFVNSSLMSLKQAIHVIMGANIGSTVTAWLLSLGGIDSNAFFMQLLKPSSFTPVLALIGIIFQMFAKSDKKKDAGFILLGFATLMFGMDTMSGAVKGLADVPAFQQAFLLFQNPLLGVLVGAVLTGIIQSSAASVGILQALAVTGQVTYGAAIPIIMGQNIGTCVTAMISSVGANKNARRAALVHLSFNIIGTAIGLVLFIAVRALFKPLLLDLPASYLGIAISHSCFNVLCTALLFPMSGLLEKLVCKLVPDSKKPEAVTELDERFFATPAVALERAHEVTVEMANVAARALVDSFESLNHYSPELAKNIRDAEEHTDHFEDTLGTYLVNLSSHQLGTAESTESAKLLKLIGDFERISDHAVNILESAEEMKNKGIQFSPSAEKEMDIMIAATRESLELAYKSFVENDLEAAAKVEPLEQVIDYLKEHLRTHHILRLQKGDCVIEVGFVWSDLITNLERISDHCSNVAGCMIDSAHHNLNLHETLRETRTEDASYKKMYDLYKKKYAIS